MIEKIVKITKKGTKPTIDITVSGNNLFYANNILTHNSGRNNDHNSMDDTATADSFGIPMSLDFMLGIIQDEELAKAGKYVLKVLKTRYGGNNNDIATIGVKKEFMRLYDLDEEGQVLPVHVKDKMDMYEAKRKLNESISGENDFVFTDEIMLGEDEINLEDI